MRGIGAYPIYGAKQMKPSKPHYHIYREVYATAEVEKRIEDHINQEMANGGFNSPHPLAIIPRGLHSYEVFFGKVEQVPLTDEEITEMRVKQEEMERQYQEEKAKAGPSRFEIDSAKSILNFFLSTLPGGEVEREQRLERVAEAFKSESSSSGPLAAYAQAIKEMKEGKEDFPEIDLGEENE